MILHSIPRKPTSVYYLLLPSCQDSSTFHLLKYSFFPVPWKEHYKWKRKLLLDLSLLPSRLPPESCVLTFAKFTLWICQVVGHLVFTVWKNNPVIYLERCWFQIADGTLERWAQHAPRLLCTPSNCCCFMLYSASYPFIALGKWMFLKPCPWGGMIKSENQSRLCFHIVWHIIAVLSDFCISNEYWKASFWS